MATFLVLHGPNLNLLGSREPSIYGNASLADINERLTHLAKKQGHQLSSLQSNSESELVSAIQQAISQSINFIIINPAAFTHTSIAIRDAFLAVQLPFIEVHLSNIYSREPFRHHSYLSDIAKGVISGLGPLGYELALTAAIHFMETH
jgi:3-dehydroquinate dehydratase-2